MDHALHAMGDAGSVGREKSGIEAPHPARRRDRPRDQKQPGGVRQKPRLAKGLPLALELSRRAVALAAKTETGLFTSLSDCGACKRTRPRGGALRAACEEVLLRRLW